MKKGEDNTTRIGRIDRMFQFGDSEGGPYVDKRTYDLMVRFSLENVELNALREQMKISDEEWARRRKVLFHKLAGQYAAAKLIVQDLLPFDKAVFQELVVDDPGRKADFELLDADKMSSEDYFKKDEQRIMKLVSLYRDGIRRRQEAGETIKDKSHLFKV